MQKPLKFKLCQCADKDSAEMKEAQYIWQMIRLLEERPEPSRVHLRNYMISDDLGNGLTTEVIVEALDLGGLFDFDYTPERYDILSIYFEPSFKPRQKPIYSTFIYHKFDEKAWMEGNMLNHNRYTQTIGEGYLRFL